MFVFTTCSFSRHCGKGPKGLPSTSRRFPECGSLQRGPIWVQYLKVREAETKDDTGCGCHAWMWDLGAVNKLQESLRMKFWFKMVKNLKSIEFCLFLFCILLWSLLRRSFTMFGLGTTSYADILRLIFYGTSDYALTKFCRCLIAEMRGLCFPKWRATPYLSTLWSHPLFLLTTASTPAET